jgi:hypothetical protein
MKKTQVEQESRIIRGAHGVASEEDHIKSSKIIGIGIGSLFIFVVGCIWAWRIMEATMAEAQPQGPAAVPAAIGQYEIGIVNQRTFDQDSHAEEKLNAQQAALVQGWGDKPGVVAHLPLKQAMERVIADNKPQPPAPPAPPEPTPPTPQQPRR